MKISVIIPSLNPDEKLKCVVDSLVEYGFDDIILEIHDMDLNGISPIDALNLLYGYQRKMKEKF